MSRVVLPVAFLRMTRKPPGEMLSLFQASCAAVFSDDENHFAHNSLVEPGREAELSHTDPPRPPQPLANFSSKGKMWDESWKTAWTKTAIGSKSLTFALLLGEQRRRARVETTGLVGPPSRFDLNKWPSQTILHQRFKTYLLIILKITKLLSATRSFSTRWPGRTCLTMNFIGLLEFSADKLHY